MDLSGVYQSEDVFQRERKGIVEKYEYMQKKFQGFQNYKSHIFILSKLEPSHVFKSPNVTLTKEQFEKISLVTLIRTICIQKLHYLAEIQYQYDIFKNKFLSFNWEGKQIKDQLHTIYKTQFTNIFELFDAICRIYEYQKNKISVNLIQPIFDHIFNIFSQYSIILNQSLFESLIFNFDITPLINSLTQFTSVMQTSLKKEFNDKCKLANDTNKKQSSVKDVFISTAPALMARKQITVKHNFMFSKDIGSFDTLHNNLSKSLEDEKKFMNTFI